MFVDLTFQGTTLVSDLLFQDAKLLGCLSIRDMNLRSRLGFRDVDLLGDPKFQLHKISLRNRSLGGDRRPLTLDGCRFRSPLRLFV